MNHYARDSIDHGTIVGLLRSAEPAQDRLGYRRLIQLIDESDTTPRQKKGQRRRAKRLVRELMVSGLVEHSKDSPAHLHLATGLQVNFSVFSELSLFLVEVAKSVDVENDPLWLVSLVEGIQENPMPILYAQRKMRRGEVIEALKQEGVPFEERMERLEQVSWDRPPCDEALTEMYRVYCESKPYLATDLFQSKCIARYLLETGSTINEFIRDYRLKRAEGL